ncbi:MAG: DsbA family oxidoreductase [Rhodovibrionaceae bacterium]
MQIDIYSDTICPWCLIGKRRLERALAARPQPGISFRWRAFQLNPTMPPQGMERAQYLKLKFGGAEGAAKIYDAVQEAGREEGIDFAFDRMQRTPNTLDSHRLIRFAAGKGREEEMVETLFQRYFLRAEDIGDRSILTAAAQEAGLDESEAAAFLGGDDLHAEMAAEDEAARRAGINGVPCFIYAGRYALSGAQPPEVLWQMFDVALAENEKQSA